MADLPELNKASPSYREFAFAGAESVTRQWLERGAAGWRMDVAPWVPDDFWREWRKVVKATQPDALTIAETWWDGSKYMLGDTFDATMNYIFRGTVLDYAKGESARKVYHNMEFMREAYPVQAFFAQMNLLSTHDVMRSLNYLGFVGSDAPVVSAALSEQAVADSLKLAKARMRLAVFFQMTFPGAPTIYYGDEVGMTGGDDPYNRGTYPWADLGGQPDVQMLADFKQLTQMRKRYQVLRHGSLSAPLYLDDHVIVLARQDGADWAIVATNNSSQTQRVKVKLPAAMQAAQIKDIYTGAVISIGQGSVDITVPALYGSVLVTREVP